MLTGPSSWRILRDQKFKFAEFYKRNKTPGQINCLNAQPKEPSLKKFHWSKMKFAVKNMISSKKRKQVS